MEVRCYSPARIRHVPGSLSDSFAAPERDVCAAALRRSPTGRRILVGSESPGPDNLADSSGHRSAARKADAETATRDSGQLNAPSGPFLDRQDTKARLEVRMLTIFLSRAPAGLQRMYIHRTPSSRLSIAPAVRISVAPYVIEEGPHEKNARQCKPRRGVARCSG